jgi:hypothetical protein
VLVLSVLVQFYCTAFARVLVRKGDFRKLNEANTINKCTPSKCNRTVTTKQYTPK